MKKPEWQVQLEEEGVDKRTIWLITWLQRLICFFDSRTVKKPVRFEITTKKGKSPQFVDIGYACPSLNNGREGGYLICAATLRNILRQDRGLRDHAARYRFLLMGIKKKYKDLPFKTTTQILFGVAVHEVRHRLQSMRRIKKFSPRTRLLQDDKLGRAVQQFLTFLFEERVKEQKAEGMPKYLIRRKNNGDEFDAQFIEHLILCRIGNKRLLGRDSHFCRDKDFVKSILDILTREP